MSGKTKNILLLLAALAIASVSMLLTETEPKSSEQSEARSKARVLITPPLAGDAKSLTVQSCDPMGKGKPAALASIYQSHSNHSFKNHPPGPVQVRIEKTAPSVVVLTSYEPVDWLLQIEGELDELVVSGYHSQSVHGVPDGVKLTVTSHEDDGRYLPVVSGPEDESLPELISDLNGKGYSVVRFGSQYEAQEIIID